MIQRPRGLLGDDGAAEMHVDKARGGELGGGSVRKGRREGPLVVVVAVAGGVVLAADVDDGVACRELSGVAGAQERRE